MKLLKDEAKMLSLAKNITKMGLAKADELIANEVINIAN
jgi:hypothetical protein